MIPLFSLASTESWGIGEFPDLALFARWLRAAGQSFVQILPITELPEAETSPYSALTAMALDPIFIALRDVADFSAVTAATGLPADDKSTLERLRSSAKVTHREVRAIKSKWLRRCFQHFVAADLERNTPRAAEFLKFTGEHQVWLDDYALFRALRLENQQLPWWEWPEPLRNRDAPALDDARRRLAEEIAYRKYLQWIAATQWGSARASAAPIEIFGDVPFMISADSPDVWTRQREFRFDGTVGVPPDAFSETGQDWGLPPWRWDVMAENDFEWMLARAERTADLFDGFRLDHLVGLFRTYIRPRKDSGVAPYFAPADEATQLALGERLVGLYKETGAEVIAEDLGTVPDFVRAALARLEIPGFKVMRWEREWNTPEQPYIDPLDYPVTSVATTGTHDTEPLRVWWETSSADERRDVLAIPSVQRQLDREGESGNGTAQDRDETQLDAILRALLAASSLLTIVPMQDLFHWRDRINTPAEVSDDNWNWLLPWRVDRLSEVSEAKKRAQEIAAWTRAAKRAND
jgi:4-alpha-glucanotransferase